jgi:hypothetical protein
VIRVVIPPRSKKKPRKKTLSKIQCGNLLESLQVTSLFDIRLIIAADNTAQDARSYVVAQS